MICLHLKLNMRSRARLRLGAFPSQDQVDSSLAYKRRPIGVYGLHRPGTKQSFPHPYAAYPNEFDRVDFPHYE